MATTISGEYPTLYTINSLTKLPREFYFYNVVFGLFQAPYYAYSQTMLSELCPRGYENMFFGLSGITNRASSIIGPNVIQAIIDNTNNNWMGFPFLFALCTAASIVIWCVDVEKGRKDCRVYVEERKAIHAGRSSEESKDQVPGESVPNSNIVS